MSSFQYAIARAAWEAHHEAKHESNAKSFDKLDGESQRAWLAAAIAVLEIAAKYASGWAQ